LRRSTPLIRIKRFELSLQRVEQIFSSPTPMESLCADSAEDCWGIIIDLDHTVPAKEGGDAVDEPTRELSPESLACFECPCPLRGGAATPQPIVATVAVHKSLGVWFGEDGSVVQIHPGARDFLPMGVYGGGRAK
jgi:hypothetical protein